MAESKYLLERREIKTGLRAPSGKKAPRPVPQKSAKMKIDDKNYKKLVREMLAESNQCEMKTPVCTGVAQGLHHVKRRGVLLLVKKYLKRSCNACNSWAEAHPIEAIKMDISKSVHKSEPGVVITHYEGRIKAIIVE